MTVQAPVQADALHDAPGVLRYAALGDSITVGIGDPMPDGTTRGWARLLAASLAPPGRVELCNVAMTGARVRDVATVQLPLALAARPHVASVVVGVNDTLRDTFDPYAIGLALTATVAALRSAGAVVLTARLPDPGRMFGLPRSLARPLARRMWAVNAVVDSIGARYGTIHVDLAADPSTYDRRMWSVDRLHPSERGHRLVAVAFADAMAAAGLAVPHRPGSEPTNPPPTRRAEAHWMATQGVAWLMRRSQDLVPTLAAMVAAEWWHGLRDAATGVDDRVACEVAEALHHLDERVAAA